MASLALVGGAALVGQRLEAVPRAAVVVAGGTITSAGPAPAAALAAGTQTVDTSGLTVVPGFIDTHVHIGFFPPHALVAGGVTTARDLGWPPDEIFPLAAAARLTSFDGPFLLAAGAMLTAPGGYPTRARWAPRGTGIELDHPGAAAAAVAGMKDRGAAVIKVALEPAVGPTLDRSILAAIVEAAHASGLKVTCHAGGLRELDKALACGVDELAHMLMGTEAIPGDVIAEMVARSMSVVPTLAIRTGAELRVAVANLGAFRAAGGRILYGTDLGNEGPEPGIDAREISLMQDAGMSPREIIAAGTTEAAAWLQLGAKGVLAAGRDADIVAVAGNPLEDARALTKVQMVFRGGRRIA